MWKRSELKSNAKLVLKKSYWKALLVSFILVFVGGQAGGGFGAGTSNFGSDSDTELDPGMTDDFVRDEFFIQVMIIAVIIGFVVLLVVAAFRIFLGYPLEIGCAKYFVQSTDYEFDLNYLGYSFKKGKYLDIVKTMLLKGVYLFLWTLLLVIPGIVKSYAYRMVPYILADNPNIGPKRAIELSNEMTRGHKFDIFILELSFFGWYLLGLLAFVVGIFFVLPYVNATYAELYDSLKYLAIEKNFTTADELNINRLELE